jgi:hypothetical protein
MQGKVDTRRVPNRRDVRLQTLDDLASEIDRIVVAAGLGKLNPLGNWSAAQIFWHLGKLIELSFDGFSWRYQRGPVWLTKLLRRISWRLLIRMAFRAGFQNPPEAVVLEPDPALDFNVALAYLCQQLGRIRSGERMTQEASVEGPYTHEQWIYIHLRHAELHLSFLTLGG